MIGFILLVITWAIMIITIPFLVSPLAPKILATLMFSVMAYISLAEQWSIEKKQ